MTIFREANIQDEYLRALRSVARGCWTGVLGMDQAEDALFSAVRHYLTVAWHEGAAECGIQPNELSAEERVKMESLIFDQFGYIAGVVQFFLSNTKKDKVKLGSLWPRVNNWSNRYHQAKTEARMMACADKKLIWSLGPTKVNCRSCLVLDGKVKRASWWHDNGVLPGEANSPMLICKGYN